MEMQATYVNPPITEISCEIMFNRKSQIDDSEISTFTTAIKQEYPRYTKTISKTINITHNGTEHKITETPVHQYETDDAQSRVVIAGARLLIQWKGKGYPTESRRLAMFQAVYEKYLAIIKPEGISQIVLRYLNKIHLREENPLLEDYFTLYPQLSGTVLNFIVGYDIVSDDAQSNSRIVLSPTLPDPDEKNAVLMDITVYIPKPGGIAVDKDSVITWLRGAHISGQKLFEQTITDKSREMFGVINE